MQVVSQLLIPGLVHEAADQPSWLRRVEVSNPDLRALRLAFWYRFGEPRLPATGRELSAEYELVGQLVRRFWNPNRAEGAGAWAFLSLHEGASGPRLRFAANAYGDGPLVKKTIAPPFLIAQGTTVGIDVRLASGGAIEVRFFDESGELLGTAGPWTDFPLAREDAWQTAGEWRVTLGAPADEDDNSTLSRGSRWNDLRLDVADDAGVSFPALGDFGDAEPPPAPEEDLDRLVSLAAGFAARGADPREAARLARETLEQLR